MRPALPQLHVVTNREVAQSADLAARARHVAAAGPLALHARAPGLDGKALLALAERLGTAGGTLIVNDRADVARALDAAGLHLPADGLPEAAARRLMGAGAWIGRSTHSPAEARAATAAGADYVLLGPIWATPSHPGRPPLGLDAIREAGTTTVIAIGGITPQRARACREAGAYGVACVSAVWNARDPGSVVREMVVSLRRAGDE